KWNDFKGLDVKGKIMICMGGAPIKKGKPVLPEDIHKKYIGQQGFSTKISQTLFRKGAAGIILIDLDSEIGVGYDQIPSQISKEKYVFKGDDNESQMGSFPSIYLVKSNFLNTIFADSKNNPLKNPDNILKHYKTQVLEDTYLTAGIEIISEDIILSNNVIGMVAGTDPELKNEYIVVGAHLDHVSPQQGQVCNGADDNASGSSGVMEIAEAVAMNPFKRSVIFITFTAEEMGLIGSRFFLNSDLFPKEQIKFNINMDMIGRSDPKNEESRAHYVVTHKKYVNELEAFINEINDGVTDFPLIINNDEDSPGGSDHQSFIGEDIPAFFFFSGLHRDLHRPTDDADKIDYPKAESISKLAYLIASKLANMETVPSFEAVK
ncbi:MAG: M28 family peptidase, partial [Bacteroidetes bacterium]|nr:M28 family peptidase [Bacteroidota bacterium]